MGKQAGTIVENPRVDGSLIEPIYSQVESGQSIDLGSIPVEFTHKNNTYREQASVTMRFVPDDRIHFMIPAKNNTGIFGICPPSGDKWDGKLKLSDRRVTLDVFCVRADMGSNADHGTLTLMPTCSVVTVTPPTKDIVSATFHLFNFPEFFGAQAENYIIENAPSHGSKLCGRAALKANGWDITIAATDKTDEHCKVLKEHGGFMITHMGKIERSDGSVFSSEQLSDVLQCIHSFLSFALGRWAGVALPIGLDSDGNRIFERWGLPMVSPGPCKHSCSWFDANYGQLLTDVFPGFMKLWNDDIWKRTLQAALYWYLAANDRGTGIGVDTGLVLAQTALERLAWTYCVEHRKMISPGAFEPRGLSAADKLRLLISTMNIPLTIPIRLSALHAKRGRKWNDAMEAITRIRNSVVHPNPKEPLPDGSYYDAWRLSLWYLDLVLLRLCGHNGPYANRLAQRAMGEVETVPWAKTTTDANTDD